MLKQILGKKEVTPDLPAHTPGINQGNATGNYEKMAGHNRDGTSTAARSTSSVAASGTRPMTSSVVALITSIVPDPVDGAHAPSM